MHKSMKNTGGSTVFYKPVGITTEIKSGYLKKSPPSKQFKNEKSWKVRYFVLYKVGEEGYQLKYFKSPEEKDKAHGEIDLLHISLMYVSPLQNPKWEWIQRVFKCSATCVLCIKVTDREYFLIGEDSEDVDSWFSVLFDALKGRPHTIAPTEETCGLQRVIQVISKPIRQSADHTSATKEQDLKTRSMSDPSSNTLENDSTKTKSEDYTKRRKSEPVNTEYDYPRSYKRLIEATQNGAARRSSMDAIYEPMMQVKFCEETDCRASSDSLMESIDQVYDNMAAQSPGGWDEKRQTFNFSSGSSDNGAASPEEMLERPHMLDKQSSTESLDDTNPEERDIHVKQADMKKHLMVTEVDGRPTVSGWTGQPQSMCLFHKGDQILAINDLHTGSVDEFNMYLSKSLKNEVKVTILRQHGCQPLHLPTGLCSG